MKSIEVVILPGGQTKTVFDDLLDLRPLGAIAIRRGSHVEPTLSGDWLADLAPVNGPVLGPFIKRSEALAAEVAWLQQNWLTCNDE
ncbi:hypothetical protein Q31b_33960 [Novipirellula aureliae]|uniref:Uncharacterized protein n=1 Tax=Novipirellula aureliae TaxID=2527966 RepID=A0A5C6DTP3_9BACT|nr:hypothetical protein [Novipirellula aureliae]TWU40052.1 hypothetical protein Q31b_33960 [Novipirellula aureliae]